MAKKKQNRMRLSEPSIKKLNERLPMQSPIVGTPEKNTDTSAFDSGGKLNFKPAGTSGTELFAGYFNEEYLAALRGRAGAKVYDEMRRSETQVVMLLNAVMNPIKAGTWEFEAAADVPDAEKHKAFIEYQAKDCIDWETHVHEALTFLIHGFSLFEVVNNVVFNHPKWGTHNGLKALAFRNQKTIERWNVDRATGNLQTVEQWVVGDLMPMENTHIKMDANFLLVFTLQKEGDNYAGISALRPMYGPWFRKNLYLKIAGIGIEKNAIGTPKGIVPKGQVDDTQIDEFKDVLSNFTAHESSYILVPEGWDVEVIEHKFDAAAVKEMIVLENTEMINSLVANFLALGTSGGSGSYALGTDLSDFFLTGIQNYANIICGVWNRKLIPDLIKANFGPQTSYPTLKATNINDKAGKELAEIIGTMIDKQAIKPDMKLEEFLRKSYNLPKAEPETAREVKPAAPAFGGGQFSERIQLGGPGSGPRPGGGSGGGDDKDDKDDAFSKWHNESKKIDDEVNAASNELKKFSPGGGKMTPDAVRATPEYKSAKSKYETAAAKQRAHNGNAPKEYLKKASDIRRASWGKKLSERIQLSEKDWKSQWKNYKDDLKEIMQDGLKEILAGYTNQIRTKYPQAPKSQKIAVATKLEPKGVAAYKQNLKEKMAEIAYKALEQAKKETPAAKAVKLHERFQLAAPRGGYFDALPPKIKAVVKTAAELVGQTQVMDIEKAVTFQFLSTAGSTDNLEQILFDIDEVVNKTIGGSTAAGMSIDAAAGNAVSQVANQARLEWFFEPEVLETIESFTFVNEDPQSEICQELEGTTWLAGDPDLDKYAPPLHHNCKSRIVPNEKGAKDNPKAEKWSPSAKALKSMTLCEGPDYGLSFELKEPKQGP